MLQIFKVRAQTLDDLARGVVFEHEATLRLGALALGFVLLVGVVLGSSI